MLEIVNMMYYLIITIKNFKIRLTIIKILIKILVNLISIRIIMKIKAIKSFKNKTHNKNKQIIYNIN